jgi:GNAT superfamily N-acetyltransferase
VGDTIPRWQTGDWWIAFERGTKEEVAFASLRPSQRWDRTGYMNVAGVLPRARGHGLQRRLIRHRLKQARRYGWHTVITDTILDNAASMNSLIASGFRPYTPAVKWGSEYTVYWQKTL